MFDQMLDIREDVAGIPLRSGAANFGSPGNAGMCIAIVGAGDGAGRRSARTTGCKERRRIMRNIWNVTAATLICTVGFAFASAESIGQEGFSDFPLVVDGSTVEDFVADRERAAGVLSELLELDVVDQGDAAIRLLQGIDDGFIPQEEAPAGLRGIGGLGVRLAARAFLLEEAHRVRGRIRDYVYVEDTASGHLAVDVRTEFFANAKDRDSGRPPVRTELLHWDIEVDGAYEVHARGLDFLDPFRTSTWSFPAMRSPASGTAI